MIYDPVLSAWQPQPPEIAEPVQNLACPRCCPCGVLGLEEEVCCGSPSSLNLAGSGSRHVPCQSTISDVGLMAKPQVTTTTHFLWSHKFLHRRKSPVRFSMQKLEREGNSRTRTKNSRTGTKNSKPDPAVSSLRYSVLSFKEPTTSGRKAIQRVGRLWNVCSNEDFCTAATRISVSN